MTAPKRQRLVTARPLGRKFAVRTRGRIDAPPRDAEPNAPAYNTIERAPGCYQRMPTCRD